MFGVQAQKLYHSAIRTLLGVRHSTPIDLCLLELNMPSLQARVRSDQRRFIESLLEKRRGMCDDPFMYVWSLCRQKNTPAYKYYTDVMAVTSHIQRDCEHRKVDVTASQKTKCITYRELNPSLCAHGLYYKQQGVNESARIAVTWLRLSSHNLAIETGRWSLIPREQGLSICGAVETEAHAPGLSEDNTHP